MTTPLHLSRLNAHTDVANPTGPRPVAPSLIEACIASWDPAILTACEDAAAAVGTTVSASVPATIGNVDVDIEVVATLQIDEEGLFAEIQVWMDEHVTREGTLDGHPSEADLRQIGADIALGRPSGKVTWAHPREVAA